MKGEIIGYIRVSSSEQNPDRQLRNLKLDKKFIDIISGKSVNRPALMEMLDCVREGDTIVIHSMARLARSLDHLRNLVSTFLKKGVKIKFIKEDLEFCNNNSPISQLLLSLMEAFAEFEKTLIHERQREGVAIAKKLGKYKGSKPKLGQEAIKELQNLVALGRTKTSIAKQFKISQATLYKYLKLSV